MTTKLVFIIIVACMKMTNSQYYGQTSTSYQPYNYYPVASTPVSPSIYAAPFIPSAVTPAYPAIYMPPPSYPPAQTSIPTIAPTPSTYAPSAFSPMQFAHTPTYQPPYVPPIPFSASAYAVPAITKSQQTALSKSTSSPKFTSNPAPKCSPPITIAYYLTTPVESPKTLIKAVKDNSLEKLPPPTYPCPFCTGFENVPKNSKLPPPPPCASVLPGILDKIPTIAIPDKLKIKELGKLAKPQPILSDLFEHKLSGKLRFDQDLLDGFLTGLGLGNCND